MLVESRAEGRIRNAALTLFSSHYKAELLGGKIFNYAQISLVKSPTFLKYFLVNKINVLTIFIPLSAQNVVKPELGFSHLTQSTCIY